MKWLKIVGLGIAIWSLSLIWLEINLVLMSPLSLFLLAGLILTTSAYVLGQQRGQVRNPKDFSRSSRPTRPVPAPFYRRAARSLHSRRTLPLPDYRVRSRHARPTRPMPS